MTKFHSITAALASLILLVACGGGGATVGTTPDPVTYADWLEEARPSTAPRTEDDNPVNGFLQSDSGSLMTSYRTGDRTVDLTAHSEQTLTFNDAFYDGNTDDGVRTFISTAPSGGTSNYFVGILEDTDLGAPINNSLRDGVWRGIMTFNSTRLQFNADEEVAMALTVNFDSATGGGTLTALTQVQNQYHLELNGNFSNRGVIGGDVHFGEDNGAGGVVRINNIRSGAGTLTGLIGQDGALGAFHSDGVCPAGSNICSGAFAGGFVALSAAHDTAVTYLDWLDRTDAAARPDTSGNQFLQGDRFGVVRGNTAGDSRDSVDLTAQRDGRSLGGSALDGVAFYQDGDNYYAGLYSSTRLGQPLNNRSQAGAWNGVLGFIVRDIDPSKRGENRTDSRDMILHVDFSRSTISASVRATDLASDNLRFVLDGRFSSRGVITGTAVLGNYNSPASFTNVTQGRLVGLIGQDGAVGAFHSNAGQTRNPFAGGFVAVADRENDGTVNYSDWTLLTNTITTPTRASNRRNGFLRGGAADIVVTSDNNNIAAGGAARGVLHFEEVFGGGQAADGVAYYQHDTGAFYAGVLSGTDLGAPLNNANQGGTWHGRLEYVAGGAPINRPLNLTVNFNARTVSAFVKATAATSDQFYFDIDGTFSTRGIIEGTTTFGTYAGDSESATPTLTTAGVLTGLIGAGGAVGAFISDNVASPNAPYAGGFVAAPNPPHPLRDVVEYSDWRELAVTDVTQLTSNRRTNQFLEDGPTGIRAPDGTKANEVSVDFNPGEGGIGGVRSYRHVNSRDLNDVGARYAGILSNTNVGPAIVNDDLNATWNGRLVLSRAESASTIGQRNLALRVNFNEGTQAGTVKALVELYDDSRPLRLRIDGTFNNRGIISGDTTMADFAPNEATPVNEGSPETGRPNYSEGDLSGLIGVNGAIGVFHSNETTVEQTGYSGGFIAISPLSF